MEPESAPAAPQIADIRRVLVALDGTPESRGAIPLAYGAVAGGGLVRLLHVVETTPRPNPLYAHYEPGHVHPPVERETEQGTLCAALRSAVPPEAQARGITTVVEVVESSDVAAAICESADAMDADLVCLATHERGGLMRWLATPVPEDVVRRSRRPVLLIPHAKPPAGAGSS